MKKCESPASLEYEYFKVFIYSKQKSRELVFGAPRKSYVQSESHYTLAFMCMRCCAAGHG